MAIPVRPLFYTPKNYVQDCIYMKKDKTILLRVSADEKQKLSVLAKNNGMAVSEYLLDRAFATPAYDLPNSVLKEIVRRRGDYDSFF